MGGDDDDDVEDAMLLVIEPFDSLFSPGNFDSPAPSSPARPAPTDISWPLHVPRSMCGEPVDSGTYPDSASALGSVNKPTLADGKMEEEDEEEEEEGKVDGVGDAAFARSVAVGCVVCATASPAYLHSDVSNGSGSM